MGHGGGMKRAVDPHRRHRFPAEIISHAVWLYFTFCLSFRDVELMLRNAAWWFPTRRLFSDNHVVRDRQPFCPVGSAGGRATPGRRVSPPDGALPGGCAGWVLAAAGG